MRLFHVEVDEAGRPVLVKGEQERAMLNNADLSFDGTVGGVEGCLSDEYKDGFVLLTNFRVIWASYRPHVSSSFDGAPCHLPLGAIAQTEISRAFLQIKPAHIKLHVRRDPAGYPSSDALSVAGMSKIKFTVKGGNGAGTWHDQLQAAIARRAWTAAPPGLLQELHTPPRGMPHTTAGPMTPPVTLLQGLTPPSASLEQHRAATASTADPGMLAQLKAMGFGESEAAAALDATGNAGVQQAATWLLDQGSSSNLLGAAAQALPDPVQPPMPLGASGVGVAGILKREERRAAQTDQALDEAFTSLSQLMAKAEEMVRLATAFRERSAAQRPTTPDGGVSEEEQMDDALARELADLGIASPVTRETAGQLYYQELSRQLAAFIEGAVAEAGGMLPLPEVYRQFCRARFTDLVSPDDVLQAVRKFPEVGAPLCLREFSSGVKVVQAAGVDEDARCKTLAELAMRSSTSTSTSTKDTNHDTVDAAPWVAVLGLGVSRAEAAEALRVPLPVAGEYLSAAEEKGLLCRDDGPEGLRFYRNFFPDVKVG